MIDSFKARSLKRFWENDDVSGLRPDWVKKVRLILDALDAAGRPEDMNIHGLRFHPLKGDQSGRYALTVSRNWRITFGWREGNAIDVDLEDYHG